MNDRIHACLDGDLARDDLSPEERARLAELEGVLGPVVDSLRALPTPDLTAAVMRSLPAREREAPAATGEPAAWRRILEWLWDPRPVRLTFRPAYALGAAMLAVFAVLQLPARLRDPAAPAGRGAPPFVQVATNRAAAPPVVYVQFRLEAEGAHQVAIAGTFNGWKPENLLEETEPGVWSALVPLKPGVHDYVFVVDGKEWIPDPHAPHVADSFGGTNSRISLPPPGSA
ncbi:MAG TPA: glycogen-binding domain-containing protein [Longimicrobiaceae bacterium]|nr:glycogen-binding domain-containing protein [Longimicrobiaceae bacterium]